ncbi:MAG TPA: GxxExxY protein [Lacipirellulaceae bacterium]|nr:GxxExxY protein [Lacipirellulaceae bacterium]
MHRVLGPGLLESAYEACFCYELSKRQISFQRQVELPLRGDSSDPRSTASYLFETCQNTLRIYS